MSEPTFVLVRPQMGENIGGAARAMWNFGLTRLRLVAPRDGWPNPRAAAMASGAGRVLDNAGLFETTADAIADAHYVFATTARDRDLTKRVMTPEHAVAHAHGIIAGGQRVAILFGPERAGLENKDIVRANAIISVPANPDFASLNLAQCVLLTAYEWRRRAEETIPEEVILANTGRAEALEVEKLAEHAEDALEGTRFFFPEHKAPHMRQNLRNLWSRMPLTRSDVQILHGVIKALRRGFE